MKDKIFPAAPEAQISVRPVWAVVLLGEDSCGQDFAQTCVLCACREMAEQVAALLPVRADPRFAQLRIEERQARRMPQTSLKKAVRHACSAILRSEIDQPLDLRSVPLWALPHEEALPRLLREVIARHGTGCWKAMRDAGADLATAAGPDHDSAGHCWSAVDGWRGASLPDRLGRRVHSVSFRGTLSGLRRSLARAAKMQPAPKDPSPVRPWACGAVVGQDLESGEVLRCGGEPCCAWRLRFDPASIQLFCAEHRAARPPSSWDRIDLGEALAQQVHEC